MKKLLEIGNLYAKQSDWKDFALVKFCLCAMGVIIGVHVNPQYKQAVSDIAAGIFVVTYIPLMVRLFQRTGAANEIREIGVAGDK